MGARRVTRADRVADIAARRVQPVLVTELALEDEELLAALVHVGRKDAARPIAHERRGARNLVPDSVEHHALDAGHR